MFFRNVGHKEKPVLIATPLNWLHGSEISMSNENRRPGSWWESSVCICWEKDSHEDNVVFSREEGLLHWVQVQLKEEHCKIAGAGQQVSLQTRKPPAHHQGQTVHGL